MSSSALEAIVKHDGRRDLLCCILDGGPLTVSQLSARMGEPPRVVGYTVELLAIFRLVERIADPGEGEPMYVATLDAHPDWVREAVEEHRRKP